MTTENPMDITLIINPDDDKDYRDQLTRDLLSESNDWKHVEPLNLATQAAKTGDKGEVVIIGQLLMQVLPSVLQFSLTQIADWLKRDQERIVVLDINGRRAKFPADTTPDALAAWIAALDSDS